MDDECEVNSPSNLASSVTPLGRRSSVPEASAEFFAAVAPLTMKLAPGDVWNTGPASGRVYVN
jgi:hypothetical protein